MIRSARWTFALASVLLLPGASVLAQRAADRASNIQPPPDLTPETLSDVRGREVRSSRGETVGAVHDFLIDPTSGNIVYAVVSTGGFIGIGDSLRLLPPGALSPLGSAAGYSVQLTVERWDKLPTLDELRNTRDGYVVTPGQRRRILAQFGAEDSGAAIPAGAIGVPLLRAGELKGSKVGRSGGGTATIDQVFIDLGTFTVSARLQNQDARDSSSGRPRAAVPLADMSLSPRSERGPRGSRE